MIEPREYSKTLGIITGEQLQSALDRFDLGELLSAESPPGGLFGQNVIVTTSKGGYVLRGVPYAHQLERERYVSQLIVEHTSVPAPWPYLIDEDESIFGWKYAIMPRMPGVQLADGEVRKQLAPDDHAGIVKALAVCLAALHEYRLDWHGVYDASAGTFVPAEKAYAEWFAAWTLWWLERCREASAATTDADVAWVHQIIGDAQPALAEPFSPRLVHSDFKEANTVAEKRDGRWQITGVFDHAETYAGDGEVDLARAYCEYALGRQSPLAQLYVDTYRSLQPPRPGFQARFRHYLLHDRLIIWEYGQRHSVWFQPHMTLREFAEPFLTRIKW